MLEFVSFGYAHSDPPADPHAQVHVIDVRDFRDPAVTAIMRGDVALLDSTGRDQRVQDLVMRTAGVQALVDELVGRFAHGHTGRHIIAIGCVGGRHRSVAIVEEVVRRLVDDHDVYAVREAHLHIDRPRVVKATELVGVPRG